MSQFFKRHNKERSEPDASSSTPSVASRTERPAATRSGGQDIPHKEGSSFVNRLRDIKSRWQNVMKIDDILQAELTDARLHPEIQWEASLRRSNDLCDQEAKFIKARRRKAVHQLRRLLEIPEDEEIDARDVPIVCLGGSGGGFRAMLGMMATMEAAKEAGIWDLITFTGGVSGSCWALGAYYTWGEFSTERMLNHFAKHSQHHPLSPKAMRETMKSPRGPYYLLAPLQQKHLAGLSQTLMDVYGSFVTAYLWLPSKEEAVTIWKDRMPCLHREWFRWSSVAPKISCGEEPMPLLTAIRHERPWKAWKDKESPFANENHNDKEHRLAQDAWWQWYEFSPFEFGCDELKYWIPIWAFGRPFENGRSTKNLPEHSLSSILGLCTSAPAAPMSIYLGTIQRSLPKGWIEGSIDNISGAISHLWGSHETKVFEGRHPVHAANEHNPLFHASPSPRPPGIENARRIHMLDSGISNNCPTYAFLHPSRGTDVIINFDASSDVMTEAAPARNQEMGDMKGLTFTKRAHPFPITYKHYQPPQNDVSPVSSTTPLPATPFKSESQHSPSVNGLPSRSHEPQLSTSIEGLPRSTLNLDHPFATSFPSTTALPSAPPRSEPNPQSTTSTVIPSSTESSTSSVPMSVSSPTVPKAAVQGAKSTNKKERAFEKAREEDVKRTSEAKAAGWSAASIEQNFAGRYAQIFDGVPTHPPTPLVNKPQTENNGRQPPPAVAGDVPLSSGPSASYNVSEHNTPLATRPISLVYMPLFPHSSNPGYDPTGDSFSGSYNLCWSEDQVATIRTTAKANFHEGFNCIRLVIREAYERRKTERLSRQTAAASRAIRKGQEATFLTGRRDGKDVKSETVEMAQYGTQRVEGKRATHPIGGLVQGQSAVDKGRCTLLPANGSTSQTDRAAQAILQQTEVPITDEDPSNPVVLGKPLMDG